MLRRLFITGASSAIIQHLIALLNKEEWEIIGLTRQETPPGNPDIQWIKGDLRQADSYAAHLENCEGVIHAAGLTHAFDPQPYFELNYDATKALVDRVRQNQVKKFVYISSRSAGLNSGAYGHSKWLAEQYIQEHLADWIIFRPAEVFGGSNTEGIDKLIHNVLNQRFISYPTGVPSPLYPLHAKDVARMMHDHTFINGSTQEVITLNGRTAYTYKDLIRQINKAAPKPAMIIPVPKWLLLAAKFMMERLRIRMTVVPDQIPRLYAKKDFREPEGELLSFVSYLDYVLKET